MKGLPKCFQDSDDEQEFITPISPRGRRGNIAKSQNLFDFQNQKNHNVDHHDKNGEYTEEIELEMPVNKVQKTEDEKEVQTGVGKGKGQEKENEVQMEKKFEDMKLKVDFAKEKEPGKLTDDSKVNLGLNLKFDDPLFYENRRKMMEPIKKEEHVMKCSECGKEFQKSSWISKLEKRLCSRECVVAAKAKSQMNEVYAQSFRPNNRTGEDDDRMIFVRNIGVPGANRRRASQVARFQNTMTAIAENKKPLKGSKSFSVDDFELKRRGAAQQSYLDVVSLSSSYQSYLSSHMLKATNTVAQL